MSLKKLKEAERLSGESDKLGSIITRHAEILEDSRCDKHALKFGGDSRFSVFTVKVQLDCHHGYYGSSGSSTLFGVDGKIAEDALNHALNSNMKLILEDMAEYARDQARELISDARSELDNARNFLKDLESEL